MLTELYWTAPELLDVADSSKVAQERHMKADVYSYGVVLYEIVSRLEPYYEADFSPKGTACTKHSFHLLK